MATGNKKYDWDVLIPDYMSSGLSGSQWCKLNGVACSSLYTVLKRRGLNKKTLSGGHLGAEAQTTTVKNASEMMFLPVKTVAEQKEVSSISIQIGKASVSITEGFNPNLLQDVCKVLESLC